MSIGPVIVDGAEVWDWTKLSAYSNCMFQGHLFAEEHLRPNEPSEALAFGIGLHRMAEVWTRERVAGMVDQPALELARAAFIRVWEAELPAELREKLEMEGNRRSVGNAVRLFEAYTRRFPLEMYDAILNVEKPFTLPLGRTPGGVEVRWSGRLDRVVRWQGGVYYIDLKTSSFSLDARFFNQFRYAGQMLGYAWAGRELLGEEFTGIMIQGIEVKAPAKTARGRTVEELIAQDIIPIHLGHVGEWREKALRKIDQIHAARAVGYFEPAMGHACNVFGNGCAYRELCWSPPELRGAKRETHYRMEPWNPLEREGENNGESKVSKGG